MTKHSTLFLALAACASLILACGSESGEDDCVAATADGPTAVVNPLQVHTGFNGRDPYQAVITTNFGDVQWASSDDNVVTAETVGCLPAGQFGITGLITTTGAGNATVTANSGDFSRAVAVEVTAYTPEQYDLGDQRYNTAADGTPEGRSCGSCHLGGGGAPHSPAALAGATDAELISAATLGKYPDQCFNGGNLCNCVPDPDTGCADCPDGPCDLSPGYVLSLDAVGEPAGEHIFSLTLEQEVGVMAFMRAIEPEGLPE